MRPQGLWKAQMPDRLSSPYDLLLCRPGAEPELCEELQTCHGLPAHPAGAGLLQLRSGRLPAEPLMFERQRLPQARFLRLQPGEAIPEAAAAAIWDRWAAEPMPWAAHVYALEEDAGGLASRMKGIARELQRLGAARHPGLARWERKPEKLLAAGKGLLWQWVLTPEGLWTSAAPPAALSANTPGGRCRMRMDPEAPSRSYLKMEEALHRLGIEPEAGQTVIDLGAAPGGWTYAFARRGCQVTAIDNGPLRLTSAVVRRVEHLHRDGMTYRLAPHLPPVDWLVGDMLIPPGQAFSLLKYWVGGRHCRRIVLNIKLPQQQPLPALLPICTWLQGRGALQLRQLYHDRREVTLFGSINS